MTHNKFTIEHIFPNRPSDCVLIITALLQQCSTLVKAVDVDANSLVISRIHTTAISLA